MSIIGSTMQGAADKYLGPDPRDWKNKLWRLNWVNVNGTAGVGGTIMINFVVPAGHALIILECASVAWDTVGPGLWAHYLHIAQTTVGTIATNTGNECVIPYDGLTPNPRQRSGSNKPLLIIDNTAGTVATNLTIYVDTASFGALVGDRATAWFSGFVEGIYE